MGASLADAPGGNFSRTPCRRSATSWRARKMSVPALKFRVTCERPNFVSERISTILGRPAISISIGRVTSFYDSSAGSAWATVLICTCTQVKSDTASIGKHRDDHTPPVATATAANETIARWRREKSRMRSIMASRVRGSVRRGLNCVEVQPGEPLQFLARLQRLAPRVEQRLHGFEILLLQFDVSGDGNCAKPEMTVGQFRCFAKFLDGFRSPFTHLGEFGLIRQQLLDEAPVEVALRDIERSLSLFLPRLRCRDT